MSRDKELIKNTLILFLGKISTQFLNFFLLPLYTRFLLPNEYGAIDLIITYIALFAPVISAQLEMAVFRFLIDYRDSEEDKKIIITSAFCTICIFLAIFVVLFKIITININISYSYYILFCVIITIIANLLLQISRGFGNNVLFSLASFVTGVTVLISNVYFIVFLHYGGKGILLSNIIGNIICIILLFLSLKIYNYIDLSLAKKNRNTIFELLRYSIPLIPNSISWWIINVSDRTIISSIIGFAANGIYAAATKFPSIISSLFSVFSMSWTESVSLHINDDDNEVFLSDILDKVIKFFSAMCICLIFFMPFIFHIFVSKKYDEAYMYIPILILGAFFGCLVNFYSAIYVAKKKTKQVANTSIFSAIINIVINLLLIKYIGIYAAALSTVISYFVMFLYRHIDIKKEICIRFNIKTVFFSIGAFIVSFIVYYIRMKIFYIFGIFFSILYFLYCSKKLLRKNKSN